MDMFQRVLTVDAASGFYRIKKYGFDRYFGPVDLGIHLTTEYRSQNSPIFWESGCNIDFLHTFLRRKREVDQVTDPRLEKWLLKFEADRLEAAREFWYQVLMGTDEKLQELF